MRKLIIPITGTLLFIAVAVFMTPLRFAVFPQPLTRNERAILQRANAGLAALATKSPTAAGLYHEALASGRWSECITIIPTGTPEKPKQKAFSVTVMSSNPLGMMAFYLHPTKSVCFMEEKCESLGFLPLGLTYAHELRHRQDFEQGLVKVSDLPDSRPVNESEARCHLTEAVILNEYTNGRFNQAVENHAQAYAKKPRSFRYKQATDKVRLDIDIVWVKQEFGEQTIADRKQLLAPLLFMAAVRTQLPKHNATSQDSLDAAVIVLKK